MSARIGLAFNALAAVSLLATPVNSQQQPFSLSIATQHEIVKVGDEVRLRITLTNTSAREIKVAEAPGDPPPAEFQYKIEVRDSKGQSAPLTDYGRRFRGSTLPRGSRVTQTLRPGESLTDETILTKLYDIKTGENYIIEASRVIPEQLGRGVVKSNVITLTVAE